MILLSDEDREAVRMTEDIRALHDHPVVGRIAEAARDVPCHLVGGMVRDTLLDRPTKDVDVTVADRGEEIARRLAETLPARFVHLGGKAFPSYRLVTGGYEIDVWDRQGSSLESDLARRDFTVNAIAVDIHELTAAPVDPFGGLEDLGQRRLRATTPDVLREDPLRVLRLARFLVALRGFTADPKTVELARAAAPGISEVASERIREELYRILSSERAVVGFWNLWETGLYPELFLSQSETSGHGDIQAGPLLRLFFEITTKRAAQLLGLSARLGWELPPIDYASLHLAMAAICIVDEESRAILDDLRARGLVSRAEARSAGLVLNAKSLPTSHPEHCRWLHAMGDLWTAGLLRLSNCCFFEAWSTQAEKLIRLAATEGDRIFHPPRLVSGDEASEILGIEPGPKLGKVLEDLKMEQVEGRLTTRDEAMAWLERHSK